MKILFLLLITLNVFASDPVSDELKKENDRLQKQIELNNKMLSERSELGSKSSLSFWGISKTMQNKNSTIGFGFEAISWGEELSGFAPTVSYAYMFNNQFVVEGSYGVLQTNNYPSDGAQTITAATRIMLKYNLNIAIDGLSIQPVVGYVSYSVSSPDAGLANDPYDAEVELDNIDSIINRSGIFGGISILKSMGKKWVAVFRGDLMKSTTFQLGYRI